MDQAVDHRKVVAEVQRMSAAQVFAPLWQDLRNFLFNKLIRRQTHDSIDRHRVPITLRRILRRAIQISVPAKRPARGPRISHVRLNRISLVRLPRAKRRLTVIEVQLVRRLRIRNRDKHPPPPIELEQRRITRRHILKQRRLQLPLIRKRRARGRG